MSKNCQQTSTIAKSAGSVGGAVMCSRILGLIREQVFAALFGAGKDSDAFVVAFRIPNLLRDLFGEGALSAAFVTVFSDYDRNRTSQDTWRLACTVLLFFTVVLSLLILVGTYLAPQIVSLLAEDFKDTPDKIEKTIWLTRIMLPFLLLVSLSAVVMGILNTKGRFFIPSLSSSFFNLGSIVGGAGLALYLSKDGTPAIVGMAWGTLVGGLLQLMIQLPSLRQVGFRLVRGFSLKEPGLRRILRLMLPATIGLSATQITIFINTGYAASCGQGAVTWLQYAFRLVQLPIGIFGVAVSIAATPLIARYAAAKDMQGLRQTFTTAQVMVFCLTIPATLGLILLADPVIDLLFEHGAFGASDTRQTALALAYYAYGLFAYAAIKVSVPVFYAVDKPRYPVIGSFLTVALNLVIVKSTIASLGYLAIPLSVSCVMALNFLFLVTILHREVGGFPLRPLVVGLGKIIPATLVMGGLVWGGKQALAPWLEGPLPLLLTAVLVLVTGGALSYGLCLHLLGLAEFRQLSDRLLARLKRH